MTAGGLIVLIVFWGIIIGLAIFCFGKVFSKRKLR